ncbi:choline dehydrogenase-like flavoprotein [Kribbella pratensis]|uniref:Choline dehydrogenase-like flavoprotein n=1 Tax=Kribbella pratensis TaxID=2512112 RepID=A0ABY2F694_9ACTN|nr:GMC family oxidoreductase [Kribbella pratensis]TDW83893.1 choline dehydrogenase-like flavoprotein [Kribbella pratensis]
MRLSEEQRSELERLAEFVLPGEGWAAAGFVERVLTEDRPDWVGRVERALADEAGADRPWLVRLIAQGYYAEPATWETVGWRSVEFAPVQTELRVTPRDELGERYDVVVVGSGAGGGAAAQVLAESGRSVLVVELGSYPSTESLARDHLRNPRSVAGLPALTDPDPAGRPRVSVVDGVRSEVLPPDGGWGNNAFTVGGGTRVYGAQAWRFVPQDFRMATTYGVPEGSALADWPISYDELEPYYSLAEQRFGVSGGGVDPWHGPRSIPLPMPPLPRTGPADLLAGAAERLGWGTLDVPLLINSVDYQGRSGCVRCGLCVGFACPVEAKAGTHNTALPAALATGNCTLVTETTAERLVTDATGRVVGVALVASDGYGGIWRRTVWCEEVVVAAGASETPRLLLNSAHDGEPHGIGNNQDQVGRHLQAHVYAGAVGLFEDEVVDLVGPGVSIATCDFRHGNDGIVGGGMLANEFVPTPAAVYDYLTGAGLIPRAGAESVQAMRREIRRMLRVVGPIQEVTSADSRVRVDPSVVDRFGNPVVVTSGSIHPEDLRAHQFMSAKAKAWLEEAGAVRTSVGEVGTAGSASTGQHQAGTCRMGDDPARSVTDPHGRIWGHDNLWITDASVHVTNGGVNPVLTVLAGALRIAEQITRG